MNWKNWTLGSTALAAGLAIASAAPSFAHDPSQGTPSTQSYQNSPQGGQNSAGSMQNSNGMTSGMSQGSSNMTGTSASTESLSSVTDAKTTLASAQVQDSNGQQVGQVANVHTSRSGHPTKIDITLNSNSGTKAKTISVNATELRYDKTSNTLISNATLNDLQSMPAASSTSGM